MKGGGGGGTRPGRVHQRKRRGRRGGYTLIVGMVMIVCSVGGMPLAYHAKVCVCVYMCLCAFVCVSVCVSAFTHSLTFLLSGSLSYILDVTCTQSRSHACMRAGTQMHTQTRPKGEAASQISQHQQPQPHHQPRVCTGAHLCSCARVCSKFQFKISMN